MNPLAAEIKSARVPEGGVALWWLAQAGFVFKTDSGAVLYVDPYLSNVVEKAFGFKRLSLAPIAADEVRAAGAGSRRDTRVLRGWSTLPVVLGPAHSMAGSTTNR